MSDIFDVFDGEQEDTREARIRQHRDDMLFFVGYKAGRRILGEILRASGVWETSFVFGESTETTEFREGRRQVGLMIYNDLKEHCPDQLLTLLRELHNGEI